jgi:hypothetical protein
MGLKASAYAALSAGCFPIAGSVASADLRPMLAAFGLAFSLASLLAITIYRKGLSQDQATSGLRTRLTLAMILVLCIAASQIIAIVMEVIRRLG